MFELMIRLYGSNGVECNQVFNLDCSTQEEIIKVFQEYESDRYIDYTDHSKILSVDPNYDNPTLEYDKILEAGGMAWGFVSLKDEAGLITPIPQLVRFFS